MRLAILQRGQCCARARLLGLQAKPMHTIISDAEFTSQIQSWQGARSSGKAAVGCSTPDLAGSAEQDVCRQAYQNIILLSASVCTVHMSDCIYIYMVFRHDYMPARTAMLGPCIDAGHMNITAAVTT